MKVICNKM